MAAWTVFRRRSVLVSTLGRQCEYQAREGGAALSFNLNESAELSAFKQAVTVTLVRQEWLDDLLSEDMDQ